MLQGVTLSGKTLSFKGVSSGRKAGAENGYQLSQMDMLEQALNLLRTEKSLKLEDVIVKEVISEHGRNIAIVQVPTTLDPTSHYNRDVLRLISDRLLNSGAGIVGVRMKVNPYIPSSKISVEEDRQKALIKG